MVFQSAEIQEERKAVTPFIQGQRAVKRRGRYFNPYSKVTQAESYRQFEYGWKDQLNKMYSEEPINESKFPALAVLILGIGLAAIMYFMFFSNS